MIRWPFTRRRPAPTTCAEAGRTGALIKADRERAAVRAKARAMCARMGKPVPDILNQGA
ncbi:hypothetical protein SKP52_02485 [Sphingopyxis fribergensis]|uniref:Uncharacterized protein n=1 Tax=Sphingopyxis fribergensis TaxID=1515612 RepID=A0A0A7PHK4_9SPHN|nr:hypothetical protein [Sphingopyxis fribergensis]AJA07432.1 hypothetical protein SKP52_02485 [Sphingopyxis fribergensis]